MLTSHSLQQSKDNDHQNTRRHVENRDMLWSEAKDLFLLDQAPLSLVLISTDQEDGHNVHSAPLQYPLSLDVHPATSLHGVRAQ